MKSLLSIIFTFAGYALVSSVYATDPCSKDFACYKVDDARFDNPYHYVFVGVYPGDELIIYPLLKDHCSLANSYCAMIVPTRGESECEFISGSVCGDIRTAELQTSAAYLNTDLWHYNLPGGSEVQPNTIVNIRNTYNSIAQASGFTDVADYFEFIFKRLQFSNEKTLAVISLNPNAGSINHPEDKTIHVLDEFIINAVERLQRNGRNIVHFYADSRMQGDQSSYVGRHDDQYLECREGQAQLKNTHRHLTNFEVFEHGVYEIYPSQLYRTDEISNNPNLYEFCYDNTVNYFNTARTEKLLGVLLTESNQLDEITGFSNAFAFVPKQTSSITDYLNRNTHELLPVISIGHYFFDKTLGTFNAADVTPIKQAISKSSHTGSVIFLFDEPLWQIRFSCLGGHSQACDEVNNGYVDTLSQLKKIVRDLRKALPGSGIMHIEAYAELIYQKHAAPLNDVIMLDDAEYLGFDCYGAFDDCGIVEIANFSDAFSDLQSNGTESDTDANHVLSTAPVFAVASSIEQSGLICSGSLNNCVSVSASDVLFAAQRSQQDYLDWVLDSLHSMEVSNPIGRKIFLVPGAFQDFNFFPSEARAMDQLDSFIELFDSSDIFGGSGSFIWGNLQEGIFPYIGARSLANVRAAITDRFRARISARRQLSLPPVMTMVGAIGARGNFDQVKTDGATQGDVYFQSTGMDSCTVRVGNDPSRAMKLNQLNHITIPNLKTPLNVAAQCLKGNRSFVKQVQFVD